MNLMQVFVFLQILDVLTTVLAIQLGGQEKNPLMGHLMHLGALQGLLVGKAAVVGIGGFILYQQRYRVLKLANYFYASVVTWNLLIVLALTGVRA